MNSREMQTIGIILSVVVIVLGVMLLVVWHTAIDRAQAAERAESELAYYHARYKWMIGANKEYGSYKLLSPNGGRDWYAPDENGALRPAEEVYPGLVAREQGWDALINYAKENGPLTLGAPDRLDQEKRLLEGAGFTVIVREPGTP